MISQYEKSATINYSLRAFSTHPFTLTKHEDPFKHVEKITNGQWTTETAGGCANNRATYSINPIYQLEVNGPRENENTLLIDLKGPK